MTDATPENEYPKEKGFFMYPREILDSGLLKVWSRVEEHCYLVIGMFSIPNQNGICKITATTIRKYTGHSYTAIYPALKQLEAYGLIKRKSARFRGGQNKRIIMWILKNPKINLGIPPSSMEHCTNLPGTFPKVPPLRFRRLRR